LIVGNEFRDEMHLYDLATLRLRARVGRTFYKLIWPNNSTSHLRGIENGVVYYLIMQI
jgi:hypothetical protein